MAEKYTIGGTVAETEAFEAFADIQQNRVLLAEKLTAGTPVKPEIIEGLTTVEDVFGHFKPKIDMDFETEEGTSKKETLHFETLGDFGVKGITAQSSFLEELTLKKERVRLRQLLDSAVETAQPLIDAKGHRLHLEVPSAPLMLEVDPVRLTQVVSNLLANAAKYTNAGGDITLGSRLETDALIIFVRDTGIGLAAENVADIFEIFVQLEPARARAQGGLGIGLALVKGLVELHGGRIHAQSAGRDRGSTFNVTFPRSVVITEPDALTGAPTAVAPREEKSRCVLIADDARDGALALAMLLKRRGHEVHVAHNGLEALELAAQVKPDIAFLDIGMPGLSGHEVAVSIRREAWGQQMTLIAVTGWGQEEDKRNAHAAGFDHHFTKPMDPRRLESIFAGRGPAGAHRGDEDPRSSR